MKRMSPLMNFFLTLLTFSSLSFSLQAATIEQAQSLKAGILQSKAKVDSIISSSGAGRIFHSGSVAEMKYIDENDSVALPILVDASGSLGQAAVFAENSVLAFLGGNIAFGNFRFATSCAKMGIGRSQLARANFAALQPPAGFLSAFSSDIGEVVQELNMLKLNVGCP